MDDIKTPKALWVLLAALSLAVLFNYLFFDYLVGISVFVFSVSLLGALFGLLRRLPRGHEWWFIAPVLLFSLMVAIRANPFLTFLNIVVSLGLLVLLSWQVLGKNAARLRFKQYLLLGIKTPFKMLERSLRTLVSATKIEQTPGKREVWKQVVKGLLMAVPVLVIFGALLSSADLAFSQYLESIVNIEISERTAQYFFVLAVAFFSGLSFLSYILFSPKFTQETEQETTTEASSGVQVSVFLGLVAALFALFIGFQVVYLFGGEANITEAGFTYAEYARRGFFELLVVAVTSLVVLLFTENFVGATQKRFLPFFIPAVILCAEVLIIMYTAFTRLSLYIDAYGLTTLRFYVAGFIFLLGVVFMWLLLKFIFNIQESRFASGILLSLIVFLISVNLVNPDRYIMRANLEHYKTTGKIDNYYVSTLSTDAEKERQDYYRLYSQNSSFEDISYITKETRIANIQEDASHWQSWSLSRTTALKALQK